MSALDDPSQRARTPYSADERTTLMQLLAFQRDTLRWKCSGLLPGQHRQQHPPSTLTLGGLLKHAALVEWVWLHDVFLGESGSPAWAMRPSGEADGWTFQLTDDDTVEQWLARLDESRALTEHAVAEADTLDQHARHSPHGEPCSLRWILLHLVQEYGRHLGQADLIRESIDGRIGV
ncbi:DinB family protein [Aestuariimicrobium soli]|uniref:DinB family protein n=1 Tax=Aestuariimicrobium soli TaxID=2035834 RepID=UPI003EBDA485